MLFFAFQPLHARRRVQMDIEESDLCYLSQSAALATQLSMHSPLAISRTHSLTHNYCIPLKVQDLWVLCSSVYQVQMRLLVI